MFVLNPDPYSTPAYRIGPFTTKDVARNHRISQDPGVDGAIAVDYCRDRFGADHILTLNGREAINLALQSFHLKKDDVVTIITTSQNFYISGCVTKEIEKFCRWNREITPETKLLFVNHEFGYIYPEMDYLVSLGIPIIEDCCTTFFSQDDRGMVGKYGDFAIYSFPKFFPIQVGGLLVGNTGKPPVYPSSLDADTANYIQKVVSHHLLSAYDLLDRRKVIFNYGIRRFQTFGFSERFIRTDDIVPSAMLLSNNGIIRDLPVLKTALWNHGIQSSIFYGEDAFFIPSHQNLSKNDIDYFCRVIQRQF